MIAQLACCQIPQPPAKFTYKECCKCDKTLWHGRVNGRKYCGHEAPKKERSATFIGDRLIELYLQHLLQRNHLMHGNF